MAHKTCLMVGKRIVQGHTAYTLTVYSATLAEVTTETLQGAVTERREFVGSRAQTQALVLWSKLTGLTGRQVA